MRWRIYISLNITTQFIFGMLGAYSVTKKGMEDDIKISENIFGSYCDI